MNTETSEVGVKEEIVLQKFEGEPTPENEFERLVVLNGVVTEHLKIENGEPVGAVEDSLVGTDLGRLFE